MSKTSNSITVLLDFLLLYKSEIDHNKIYVPYLRALVNGSIACCDIHDEKTSIVHVLKLLTMYKHIPSNDINNLLGVFIREVREHCEESLKDTA